MQVETERKEMRETKEDGCKENKRRRNMRRVEAYLTDNVVIVRQVVSVSLGSGRRGVAQFPYVWLRAVRCCGNREAVRLWLAALWAVLTAAGQREIYRQFLIYSAFVSLQVLYSSAYCETEGKTPGRHTCTQSSITHSMNTNNMMNTTNRVELHI